MTSLLGKIQWRLKIYNTQNPWVFPSILLVYIQATSNDSKTVFTKQFLLIFKRCSCFHEETGGFFKMQSGMSCTSHGIYGKHIKINLWCVCVCSFWYQLKQTVGWSSWTYATSLLILSPKYDHFQRYLPEVTLNIWNCKFCNKIYSLDLLLCWVYFVCLSGTQKQQCVPVATSVLFHLFLKSKFRSVNMIAKKDSIALCFELFNKILTVNISSVIKKL